MGKRNHLDNFIIAGNTGFIGQNLHYFLQNKYKKKQNIWFWFKKNKFDKKERYGKIKI